MITAAKNKPFLQKDVDDVVCLKNYPFSSLFVYVGVYPVTWRVNPLGIMARLRVLLYLCDVVRVKLTNPV